jgi:hypothetical protein
MSDPREYVTADTDGGSLDEKKMAYQDRIQTYQRIRTVILRDAWLIDHDHRENEREDGVEEGASDAACSPECDGSLSRRQQNRAAGPINPTTRTAAVAAVTPMPRWARRQRRTSRAASSTTIRAAEPRLAAPDADG